MITFEISGVSDALRRMDDIGRQQLPFAIAKALTLTVKQAQAAETAHIREVFDRPTPFTQRAVAISAATKTNLAASVFVKSAQAKYLKPEMDGGSRPFKSFEQKFATDGQTPIVLPGRGIPLNSYGNISRAKIKRIAEDVSTYGLNKRFFSGKPKGHELPAGVYARTNNNQHITPLLVFATDARYQKRFEFSAIATDVINQRFEVNMMAAWAEAVATARR